jgi:hypothetical protein
LLRGHSRRIFESHPGTRTTPSPPRMRPLPLVSVLLLAACVKSYVPDGERVFPPGRYDYHARLLLPGATDSTDYRGVLALGAVTPDSLAGRWEVPGYAPELRENHFNVVSFNVHARLGDGPDSLTVVHALQRDDGGRPRCAVRVTRTGYIAQGRCSLNPAR